MSGWGHPAAVPDYGTGRGDRVSYIPPHLRGGGAPPAMPGGFPGAYENGAAYMNGGRGYGGPPDNGYGGSYGGRRGGGSFQPRGGGGYGGPPRGGGAGWGSGGGDRGTADPFAEDDARKKEADAIYTGENTGINFDAYDDIPVDASGDNVPPAITSFEDVDLGAALMANVRRCKYTKPTPVQRYSIPIGLASRDLMACAQTGSGKTAAFCFPMIANLLRDNYQPAGRSRKVFPVGLILSPTRELSSQIYEEARKFSYQTGIRPVVVYGGAPVVNQVAARLE